MTGQEEAGEGRPWQNDDMKVLFSMVTKLFEHWRLSDSEQMALLGLPPSDQGAKEPFRAADVLGFGRDVEERVGILLGIHLRLRMLFPSNPDLARQWMTSANRSFEEMRPVDVVQAQGLSGLIAIRAYLDQAIDR